MLRKEYIERRLTEIKVQFSQEAAALASGNQRTYSRGRGAEEVEPTAEQQQAFVELKNNTLIALKELAKLTTDNSLNREIELLHASVSSLKDAAQPLSTVALDRSAVAQYTQSRMLGAPVTVSAINVARSASIFQSIANDQFDEARMILRQYPSMINAKSSDQFQATALITGIARLSQKENPELRKFVMQLLTQPSAVSASLTGVIIDTRLLDTAAQDAQGNTALHRAAWYGEVEICFRIIAIAKENNQLDALLRVKNNVATGASVGETVLDNIRRSPKLSEDQKQSLQCELSTALASDQDYKTATDVAQLNSHCAPHWNTPMMQLLRDLRDTQSQSARDYILRLLDTPGLKLAESNYNGDTLLHYAIWFGEFEVANKIIAKASISGDLPLLCPWRV
ncbi:MAG TPA: hypothetical protein VI522_03800 [Gammaproteobacteria bacterium]|nr:hypothetical protein [Gammaproteobacteria bacterium]